MKKLATLTLIIVILIVFVLIKYVDSDSEAIYVNGGSKEYLVQNLTGKEQAAELLDHIQRKIDILKNHLIKNQDSYSEFKPYIRQLSERIDGCLLYENAPNGKYTSFTSNKGEEIAICLRSKINGGLHDLNILTYVTLHELAHVACPEKDHTDLFKKIFKFFLKISSELGIYQVENYVKNPREYCGMTISEKMI